MPFKHVSAAAFLQSLERSALAFSGPDRAEAIWPKNVKVAHRYSFHLSASASESCYNCLLEPTGARATLHVHCKSVSAH